MRGSFTGFDCAVSAGLGAFWHDSPLIGGAFVAGYLVLVLLFGLMLDKHQLSDAAQ